MREIFIESEVEPEMGVLARKDPYLDWIIVISVGYSGEISQLFQTIEAVYQKVHVLL